MPVKKVEIFERESIQEFSRESKRQILEEACLVFEGQLHLHHHNWFFLGVWPTPDSYTPLVAQGRAACGQARPPGGTQYAKITGSRSYKTFTIFWWCCWLKSTFPVVRFTTKLFFFVFLKKIHSHSPCQFAEGPPARRQDPKSTLVALTAAPLILPFFQVQDKTSRDSSFVFATCKVCCKLELRRYLSSSTAGRAQCQASRGRSLQYKDRTTSRAL